MKQLELKQREYAIVKKSNMHVIEVCTSFEEITFNEDEPMMAIDITDHVQKQLVKELYYYNDETNTFSEYPKGYIPPEPEPSLEEQLAALKEENQTLMLAIAEQYEKQLAAEENQQIIMLAIAELYETQTSAAL